MSPNVRYPATRTASEALEWLLTSETWAGLYTKHQSDPDQLAARAGRFRAALVGLGDSYSEEAVRAALLERAGSGSSSTPAESPEPPARAPEPELAPDTDQGLDERQADIERALEEPSEPKSAAAETPAPTHEPSGPADQDEGGYVEGEDVPDPEPPDTSEASEPDDEPEEEPFADVVWLADRRPAAPEPVEEPDSEEVMEEVPAGVVLGDAIAAAVEADEERAREGLRELLEQDRLPGFYDQTRLGLIRLATTAREYQHLLARNGVETTAEAVEVLVPELAREFAPGSAAAVWESLLEKLRKEPATNSSRMREGYAEPVAAITRLATADPEHYKLLTRLALYPPSQDSLVAAAKSVYAELRRRGVRHEPKHFSDHVWQSVHDTFSGYPGAEWHEAWAAEIRGEVMRRVHARHGDAAHESSGVPEALQAMADAEERRDRRAYREAARRAYRTVQKL